MAGQIVRVWKGYGTGAGVESYCREHFPNSVLPHLRSIAGFVGARVLTRAKRDETVLTATRHEREIFRVPDAIEDLEIHPVERIRARGSARLVGLARVPGVPVVDADVEGRVDFLETLPGDHGSLSAYPSEV